jgi:hypothetical protein
LVPILLKKPKLKNHFFRLFENPKHMDGFTKEWINEIGCFIGGYLKKTDILNEEVFYQNRFFDFLRTGMIAKGVPIFYNHPKLVWFRSLSFFQEGEPTSSWGGGGFNFVSYGKFKLQTKIFS